MCANIWRNRFLFRFRQAMPQISGWHPATTREAQPRSRGTASGPSSGQAGACRALFSSKRKGELMVLFGVFLPPISNDSNQH